MNHPQPYLDSHPAHISTGPSYPPHSQTAGGMSQYPQYSPQQGYSHSSYGGYYGGGVSSPQSINQPVSSSTTNQLAPLPAAMGLGQTHTQHAYSSTNSHGQGYSSQSFDSTGQVAPPGVKPRVTATLWEDEGSLCFQVEAKGVCVARREDNHFINGTKLLNVAGMTRGRRDGILKSEKTRHVVKIGPMHLKGVWIPFDRALDFANREKITELLYPLFVHNIGALLYHPTNSSRTNMVMEAAKKRGMPDGKQLGGMLPGSGPQSAGLHHHHSMSGQLPSHVAHSPHPLAPQPGQGRPNLDRAHTFPTPPTSASSIIGAQGGSYEWGNHMGANVQSGQPLAIDTGLSNTRSMPSTPATTPPGSSLHNLQSYPSQQSYDNSRSVYSAAPQQQSQFATQQQNLARFGGSMPPTAYLKSEMGPPAQGARPGEGEHQGGDAVGHGGGDEEAEHEHDTDYARGNYSYGGPLHSDHSHISPEQINGSPHQNGSGRITPRTSISGQPGWSSGYNTPPRTATSSSLYSAVGDARANGDAYGAGYPSGGAVNGTTTGTKRGRDDDDGADYKGHGPGAEDLDALKRRKSIREESISNAPSVGGPMTQYDHEGRPISRSRSTIIQRARR